MRLEDGLELELEISQRVASTEDAREGPRAFTEKRKPDWKAR
jgi:enoyl-CoA hydratase/carnithine racemase